MAINLITERRNFMNTFLALLLRYESERKPPADRFHQNMSII